MARSRIVAGGPFGRRGMQAAELKVETPTVPLDFAAPGPLTFRVRSLAKSQLRVIEVDYRDHGSGENAEFPLLKDTYTIGVRCLPETSRISVHGQTFSYSSPSGYTHFLNLSGVDFVELNTHSHTIELLLSRKFMDEVAEDLGVKPVASIGNDRCFLRPDPVIPKMTEYIRPFLDDPKRLDALHADSFMWAFGIYVLRRYGGLEDRRHNVGGLSVWQERLAKEWMEATLQSGTSLTELARACGLSVSHFSHSFRRSAGVSPYRWLVNRRVERAKGLLQLSLPLAAIAQDCGFADQSHLSRIFKKATGMAPRTWQLAHQLRVSETD